MNLFLLLRSTNSAQENAFISVFLDKMLLHIFTKKRKASIKNDFSNEASYL
jgi:hypothetical protein